MIKVSLKEILKSDVSILNKYFLVTLIIVLLTIVGYTSYALFSHEEVSSTGIRLKYSGSIKKSVGNLSTNWKDKTENEAYYLALYTLGSADLPETYDYNDVTYTLSKTYDVSEQSNGNVILGEYKNDSNYIAIIGQDGKVIAPQDSSYLFALYLVSITAQSNLLFLDLSNLDTSNVTNMSYMFYICSSLTSLDLSGFDTSNVTTMYRMFKTCHSLTSLDLTSFDTRKVTNMAAMFYTDHKLTKVIVGCNFVIGTSTDTSYMFDQAGVSSFTKVCDE